MRTKQLAEDLAASLGCRVRQLRPCLLKAWQSRPKTFKDNRSLRFLTVRFVGLECLAIGGTPAAARDTLLGFGAEKAVQGAVVSFLAKCAGRDLGPKGCNSIPHRYCIGKDQCAYYQGRLWQNRDPAGSDLKTLYLRRWPELLTDEELTIYRALMRFEKERDLAAGADLFFCKAAALRLTHMGQPKIKRLLESLAAHGLVKVLSQGQPGTRGERVKTRTIARTVPIPAPDEHLLNMSRI